jgi:hypothetical protein
MAFGGTDTPELRQAAAARVLGGDQLHRGVGVGPLGPGAHRLLYSMGRASLHLLRGCLRHLAGLASRTGPGLGRPAPSAATQLVCALVPTELGPSELVFATDQAAGLRG